MNIIALMINDMNFSLCHFRAVSIEKAMLHTDQVGRDMSTKAPEISLLVNMPFRCHQSRQGGLAQTGLIRIRLMSQ
jgi:hypothetical protein